mgnify:CR=1 FL=1
MYESIALVGATGAVGRIVLEQLSQREFPYERLKLLASERSVGKEVSVGSETLKVELLQPGAFKDVDLVIAAANVQAYAPAGFPAITGPASYDAQGQPASIVLVGDYLGEPALIAAAYAFEQATQARVDPDLEATMKLIEALSD